MLQDSLRFFRPAATVRKLCATAVSRITVVWNSRRTNGRYIATKRSEFSNKHKFLNVEYVTFCNILLCETIKRTKKKKNYYTLLVLERAVYSRILKRQCNPTVLSLWDINYLSFLYKSIVAALTYLSFFENRERLHEMRGQERYIKTVHAKFSFSDRRDSYGTINIVW